ncbi:hypothetical protein QBC38DRAFT_493272 [Podospora fimiseda]|uniref:Uncharacterized protein n=1 Tax=Podospora fimiseda TaxID=252190 RepID=A0AAN7BEI3_9PEZI|nr:hypothetical protein QBC38DRAFT_493272 [Podospora fimiseda]
MHSVTVPNEYFPCLHDDIHPRHIPAPSALGTPSKRKRIANSHAAAFMVSLICLALGVLTIHPKIGWAWNLGFKYQIVAIGLLLSMMGKCTDHVFSFVFLLVEARFGQSHLQNFEAILTSSPLGSKVSWIWRLVLSLMVVLPLSLSVGYKQFIGGTAESNFNSSKTGSYGVDFPHIGPWEPPVDSLYLLLTALAPFQATTNKGKGPYPQPHEFPVAYGYNILLLSDYSAAVLDIPSNEYISDLQAQLNSPEEALTIKADVDGYLSSFDASFTTKMATDDALWSSTMRKGYGLGTIELYRGQGGRLGVTNFGGDENNQMLIGLYYNSSVFGDMHFYSNASDPEALRFRSRAQMYLIRRARCRGEWRLNLTGIFLEHGSCDPSKEIDLNILRVANMMPFPYDVLPPLLQIFSRQVRSTEGGPDPAWLQATYSVCAAVVYWARGLYMFHEPQTRPFEPYESKSENLTLTRHTLKAEPALYIILALHPFLVAVGLMIVLWLHGCMGVPIGKGFSFVSILSGVDAKDLHLIQGAGLSGKLR